MSRGRKKIYTDEELHARHLESMKRWVEKNREKKRAANKRWRENNLERVREQEKINNKKYRENNREKINEYRREYIKTPKYKQYRHDYYMAHIEQFREYQRKSKAKRKGNLDGTADHH